MNRAPVALFAYNRPSHTRRTVEALAANAGASDSDLFIFSDAAKNARVEPAVGQVREFAKSIRGFRTVTVVERPANLGLRASIIDGITRLCRERGRVIVLEDDLVTSPHFLEFMNGGLEAYQGAERVMQIAGYTFSSTVSIPEDALFLTVSTSWGWATWERAWKHFNPDATGYERIASDPVLREKFNLNNHYGYFDLLRAQREGRRDSWAILWYLSVFLQDGLVLYPRKTLVRNIGFDGSGANRFIREFAQEDLDPDFRVVTYPQTVAISPHAQAVIKALPSPRLTPGSLLRWLLGRFSGGFSAF
jgi:hypothetical protein